MYTYVFQKNERNDRKSSGCNFLSSVYRYCCTEILSSFFSSHPTYPYVTIFIHKSVFYKIKNTTLTNNGKFLGKNDF